MRADGSRRGNPVEVATRLTGSPRASALAMTKNAAFTMAEILLSLTIIGVVAAITLPSLTGNINERTWNTQRKALYARFSQAVALMPALNGYGTLIEGDSSTSAIDTAAETFITSGLSKVLKINNICDSEHLEDCGIPNKITPIDGGKALGSIVSLENISTLAALNTLFASVSGSISKIDTAAAAFETANGESILVYYNPRCVSELPGWQRVNMQLCANFVYDLNGTRGPNTVGKDIGFISALYPTDSVVVAPMPTNIDIIGASYWDASTKCRSFDNARMPNKEELASLLYNKILIGNFANNTASHYWSSTFYDENNAWLLGVDGVYRNYSKDYYVGTVRCIKR